MVLRASNVIVALLMFVSVGLQVNDPDAIVWMAVYAAAGALAALAAFAPGRYPWTLPALVGLVALVWAGMLAPGWIGQVPIEDLFEEFEMADEQVEVARECLGLLIVCVWMTVLVVARLQARAAERRQAGGAPSTTLISR